MGRTRRTATCWLSCSLAAALFASHVEAQVSESYRLDRGVIVDRNGASVFVLGKPDGLDALDGRTLAPRAHTAAAVMPLIVVKGRLLALAASGAPLRLVWLDARSLARKLECAPVALPPIAQPSPVDGLGSSFELSADRQGERIYVRWAAATSYVGGVPPSPEQQAAANRQAEGVVSVDWETGATEIVADAPADSAPQAYGMDVPYLAGPFAVGGLQVSVEVPDRAGEFDLAVVKRKQPSDPAALPDVSIALPGGLAILSLDRGYLLVPLAAADGTLSRAQLWSLATGRASGRFPLRDPPSTCAVAANGQLLFVAQSTLFSVSATRPARPSARALRPTAYLGPYPPSAPAHAGPELL